MGWSCYKGDIAACYSGCTNVKVTIADMCIDIKLAVLGVAGSDEIPGLDATVQYQFTITPATGAYLADGDDIVITGAPANTSITCETNETTRVPII